MAIGPIAPPAVSIPAGSARAAGAPRQSFGALVESKITAAAARAELARPALGPALEAMKQIELAQKKLDAVLEAARRGKTFSAQELLAIQSQAYRYAQTVDLASKVVEQGAQSVKQALNTQV